MRRPRARRRRPPQVGTAAATAVGGERRRRRRRGRARPRRPRQRRRRRRIARVAVVRRRDDGQPVPVHQGGRGARHVGQARARPRGVLQLGDVGAAARRGRPAAGPAAHGGRLVPAAEEVVHDAAAHVGPLRRRVRVVHAGRRRRVRAAGPAGRAAAVRGQPQAGVHRAGGPRQPGGVRAAQPRVRRELLHGRPRRDHEPRDAGPRGAAHQALPEEPVHRARGRRAGPVRAKVRGRVVHVVLRGNGDPCTPHPPYPPARRAPVRTRRAATAPCNRVQSVSRRYHNFTCIINVNVKSSYLRDTLCTKT